MIDKNVLLNIALFKKYPVSFVHFVTSRCNARCSFCFIDFDNPITYKNELTIKEIEKISKSLGPTISNINLTGGEPFARKDFTEIADLYFKNSAAKSIYITTNGSLPDRIKKFVNLLSPKYPNKKITFSISIDDFPIQHNKIRKLNDLFDKCIESYRFLHAYKKNILANVGITVSQENFNNVEEIYNFLRDKIKIKSFTSTIVRDEGIYSTPNNMKSKIVESYRKLTKKIKLDIISGKIDGYDKSKTIGKFLNSKNMIMNEKISEMYLNNDYISPCHASSLFGVMYQNGDLYPCEILDKKIGNIRDVNYDFLKLWFNQKNKKIRNYIKQTKCRCSYECAWTFNILGNARYYPKLIKHAYFK